MNKAYDKVTWQNTPNTATPLSASNLNKMSDALDTIDDRVIVLDTNKANTSDVTTALAGKVDKETGKGLSTNDFTDALKTKLDGISANAKNVAISGTLAEGDTVATISIDGTPTDIKVPILTVDETPSPTSTNPLENKAVYELVQSILPEETAEGNPISVTDASGLDAKSALVTFSPKQSGTGDPSPTNIRPISGWDSLNLNVSGPNLWDEEIRLGYYDTTGGYVSSSSNICNKNIIPIPPRGIRFICGSGYIGRLCWYDANGNFISSFVPTQTSTTSFIPTIPENARYLNFDMKGGYGTTYLNDISINYPSTFTDYEPFKGLTTHTATFSETIMGGSYDFVSGEGVNPWCAVKVDLGSLNYTYSASGGGTFRSSNIETVVLTPASNDDKAGIMCECYTTQTANDVYRGVDGIGITIGGKLWIHDTRTTDPDAFKSLVNGLYLIYPLTTPTHITLTPTDVNLLKGSNTVWTDGDTVQIKYSVSIESLIPASTRNLTKSSPITEPQTKETETEITEETEETEEKK